MATTAYSRAFERTLVSRNSRFDRWHYAAQFGARSVQRTSARSPFLRALTGDNVGRLSSMR